MFGAGKKQATMRRFGLNYLKGNGYLNLFLYQQRQSKKFVIPISGFLYFSEVLIAASNLLLFNNQP
jgi:hypothetical protein